MDHVCTQCGRRQVAAERCSGCGGDDGLLDLGDVRTRELLVDMETRRRDRREAQLRMLAVVIGIGVVVGLWLVPGFWSFRTGHFAMPFLIDQWALMIGIAFGTLKLLSATLQVRPRFPFIDASGRLD